MNTPWSDPLPLCRYREAPREKGLYLIGTSNIDSLPVKAGDSSDLYLGENFPDNFFMLYVGQSIDGKSTIRKGSPIMHADEVTSTSEHWRGSTTLYSLQPGQAGRKQVLKSPS
jgi:hypothetical protein